MNDSEPYMRAYMRQRYQKDPVKATQYRNTCRLKAKVTVPAEDVERYGIYLADIVSLKKIIARVPPEMLGGLLPLGKN